MIGFVYIVILDKWEEYKLKRVVVVKIERDYSILEIFDIDIEGNFIIYCYWVVF